MRTKNHSSIELFSGAGGLALGLCLGGFAHRLMIERDTDSVRTLKGNWLNKLMTSGGTIASGDVRELSFTKYRGKVDLVAGGPPCQPFSLGGKHKAHCDDRDMFPQAVRTVREIRPRAFVFENVKGLLRKSFSSYFEYILLQLTFPDVTKLPEENWEEHLSRLEQVKTSSSQDVPQYNVVFRLLNAADYGVPQKRERVFIVGFRSDLGISWTFPEKTHSQDALLWSKYVSKSYWDKNGIPIRQNTKTEGIKERLVKKYGTWGPAEKPWRTLREALQGLPCPVAEPDEALGHIFRSGARSYKGHTGSDIDEPSKTLKAGDHGVPGGENMIRFEDESVRYLTVREAARLQTFPDDYKLSGSWTECMRQIGNAVPVALGTAIGLSVANTLHAK